METPSHPRGLWYLFFAEAWERFSFYGMRALLVLYMTQAFAFSDERAYDVYGAYTACAYFTPIVGGVVADRVLGKRRAIILGGSVMAAGHFMMAFEPLFYPALVVIALGILLTNTKRWRGLARGAKRAASDFENEIQKPDDR